METVTRLATPLEGRKLGEPDLGKRHAKASRAGGRDVYRRGWVLSLIMIVGVSASSGCATGRVAQLAEHVSRAQPERLTVTSLAVGDEGSPFGITAVEGYCRIAPNDPEGGPGAAHYVLDRRPLDDDQVRLVHDARLELIAGYRADTPPPGFPDAVIVGLDRDDDPALYVRTPRGWIRQQTSRFDHDEAAPARPVLAGFMAVLFTPFTLAFDIATLPIQWLIAPVYPIVP
jgi:hypothetical protein